jgi:peptidoglycan/LPS O-acetylase OafA/YrhL
MMGLMRNALLVALAVLMVSTVAVGLGTPNTGPFEKALLLAFGAMLVLAAVKVHRIGTDSAVK